MFAALLATLVVAAPLSGDPPPPITVSLNQSGQYSRGEYAQVQFRAAADGYVLILQADENGRIRVLFPIDPGDDNYIRGGKTYKVVGRDNRGSFYLEQAGGSGMVYAAWSKSPFQVGAFVRGDHWDYSVFDQYNAADDPESQLTDFVLLFTNLGFDYALDRYIVYSASAEYVSDGPTTYIGVNGWPWPSYYDGWSVGISFGVGCCYNSWYPWYPWYGYGYPWYGWGYPGYGWGYPGYGWGYPGYGWGYGGGAYYPGYPGYPGYGAPGYRPYTFKPGGTVTAAGNPYRPRGDQFAPQGSVFQTSYRSRPAAGAGTAAGAAGGSAAGNRRGVPDAAMISGRAEAGRRSAASPIPQADRSRPRPIDADWAAGSGGSTATRRTLGGQSGQSGQAGQGSQGGQSPGGSAAGAPRKFPVYKSNTPRRSPTAASGGGAGQARGWSADGTPRTSTSGRPGISPTAPGSGRSGARSGGGDARGRTSLGEPRLAPRGGSSSGSPGRSPSAGAAPRGSSGGPPAASGGGRAPSGGGGGARAGGGGG
ncbi:MAG TPA: DUF4384 domain-containing protein, partial [Gemmatimonadales bacterium]|nr:DUF4384 domain-containing protein [Gemmatimonadales bacterium]